MRSKNKTNASRNMDLRKIAAAMTCMVLLFVLLFSISYITLESDHDCCGENCHICECMEACGNALQMFRCGTGTNSQTVVAAHAFILVITLGFASLVTGRETPVSDKIRLNI